MLFNIIESFLHRLMSDENLGELCQSETLSFLQNILINDFSFSQFECIPFHIFMEFGLPGADIYICPIDPIAVLFWIIVKHTFAILFLSDLFILFSQPNIFADMVHLVANHKVLNIFF